MLFVLTRKQKIIVLVAVDVLLITLACVVAYYFMRPYVVVTQNFVQFSTVLSIGLYILFGFVFNVFMRINRYTNLREIIAIFLATTCQFIVSLLVVSFLGEGRYSRRFELLAYILSLCLIVASRLVWRIMIEHYNQHKDYPGKVQRTIIIGAGEGGRILFNSLIGSTTAGELDVIGFVDDDPNKLKTYLSGKKVLGSVNDLSLLIKEYQIDMVTIAIPSLSRKKLQEIITHLADSNWI